MGGPPGLLPAKGDAVALGQVVHALEGVAHLHALADAPAHGFTEILLQLLLDDKDNRFKPGPPGVVDRVVNDALPITAHRVHLLESAIPAAQPGGQDDQNRFFHM